MINPTLPQFQYEIGARMSRGDWQGAAHAAAGCRAAWPADPCGWLLGSMAALFADQKETALALVEERLAVDPGNVQCLIQRAECLFALGERARSMAAADTAAAGAQGDPQALDAIGSFLVFARDYPRALSVYAQAVAAAPADPSMLSKRALMHRFLGDFDLAASDYESALLISPAHAEAFKGLSELSRQSAERNVIASAEAALAATPVDSPEAATLRYGLAKSYEDLGEHAQSWQHLSSANRIERRRHTYDTAQDRGVVERIVAGFQGEQPVVPDTTGESPIFIVGLPRTGTTLVERIIGNHSLVHPAGELLALRDAVGAVVDRTAPHLSTTWLGYAEALGDLPGEPIAREYLARSRAHRGDRPRFTDKAPANFYYCGLILRAFPNARIVHLTRHPMAACYAIYKTRFEGGFAFSYDLLELAEYYLGYHKLMAHWHRVLPGRILDVAYEQVVTAQEATTQRILDYLGLPFEEGCLAFHLNPAPASTPSAVQVRQPLYSSSLEQWRHYSNELAPLRERLAAGGVSGLE
ncbi:MAG: sulfotransferase [Steroidobacteraceae bacterium]|jgi:tetratricopeptide (TPR) repeat protein